MQVVGVEYVLAIEQGLAGEAKLVLNDHGAVFGSVRTQHRDLRIEGVAYADEYKGNALAAMLGRGSIEFRYHAGFGRDDVTRMMRALVREPALAALRSWRVTDEGRALDLSGP